MKGCAASICACWCIMRVVVAVSIVLVSLSSFSKLSAFFLKVSKSLLAVVSNAVCWISLLLAAAKLFVASSSFWRKPLVVVLKTSCVASCCLIRLRTYPSFSSVIFFTLSLYCATSVSNLPTVFVKFVLSATCFSCRFSPSFMLAPILTPMAAMPSKSAATPRMEAASMAPPGILRGAAGGGCPVV